MLLSWEQQGGLLPHLLKRFIDDIFFLWHHGKDELDRFVAHLNAAHPTIRFEVTADFILKSAKFLDLTVWVDEQGYLQTTLSEKPCRVVSYLLPSSSHPSFILSNIPYSLAFRLVRIESTRQGLEHSLAKLEDELVSRGYRRASVAAAVDQAKQLSRTTTLKKVPRPENKHPLYALQSQAACHLLHPPQAASGSSVHG